MGSTERYKGELLEILKHFRLQAAQGLRLSCEELASNSSYSTDSIHAFFTSKPVAETLKKDGLRPPLKRLTADSLTSRQLRVINHVTNPYTQKSLQLLLKEQNTSLEEWRQWLSRPHFRNFYNSKTVSAVREAKGEIVRKTVVKAQTGDTRATELYFRIIDEPLPELTKASQSQNSIEIPELLKVLQRTLPLELLQKVALELAKGPEEPLDVEGEELLALNSGNSEAGVGRGEAELAPLGPDFGSEKDPLDSEPLTAEELREALSTDE